MTGVGCGNYAFLAVFCGQQATNNDVAGRVIQVPLFYGRTAADFRLWSGLLRQLARGVPWPDQRRGPQITNARTAGFQKLHARSKRSCRRAPYGAVQSAA
jgi:hypothetical protein